MSLAQIRRYLEVIPAIRAGEQLEEALVAQFPYMTAEGRRELFGKWELAAGYAPAETTAPGGVPVVPREHVKDFFRSLSAQRGQL